MLSSASGAFAIAADRYEEETGDTELAALMRIPGIEWELVEGTPGLRMTVAFTDDARWFWWTLHCGPYDFGTVGDNLEPEDIVFLPIFKLLDNSDLGEELAPRLYQLYREAVERECVL